MKTDEVTQELVYPSADYVKECLSHASNFKEKIDILTFVPREWNTRQVSRTFNVSHSFVHKLRLYQKRLNRCQSTIVQLQKAHTSNQKQHLKDRHRDIYAEFQTHLDSESHSTTDCEEGLRKDLKTITNVPLNKQIIKTAILKLVTVDGRPFSIIQDEGMRMILDPLLSRLPEKYTLNEETVKEDVIDAADKIKKRIQEEILTNKLVSLKVDIASRLGRSFLGVNIQFIKKGKITIRTLAVEEITNKHSGENLKTMLLNIFDIYGIDPKNIYSFTSDNGTNMIKLSALLAEEKDADNLDSTNIDNRNNILSENVDNDKNAAEDIVTVDLISAQVNESNVAVRELDNIYPFEDNDIIMEQSESKKAVILSDEVQDDQIDPLEYDLANSIEQLPENLTLVNVRCAAHTLQLAVQKAIKKSNLNKTLVKARGAAKILRVDSTINAIRKLRPTASKPILDLPTRWQSTYDMLSSLLKLEDFKTYVPQLTLNDWLQIKKFIIALKPAKEATLKLQREQLTLPEFYSIWLMCLEATEKLQTPLSKNIVKYMKVRQEDLFNNEAFTASVYLDPLYNVLLTPEQEIQAIDHLCQLWKIVNDLKKKVGSEKNLISSENQAAAEKINNTALPTVLLQQLSARKKMKLDNNAETNVKLLLSNFKSQQERTPETPLLEYWEMNKILMPELYELAKIILATPATQVTVERLFSGLKYIFSDLRNRLKSNLLNSIMVVRTNYKDIYSNDDIPNILRKNKQSLKNVSSVNTKTRNTERQNN